MSKRSKLEKESTERLIETLLIEAKKEIGSAEQLLAKADEAANQHYHTAADRIADAQRQQASQRQIADELGKSPAWVNQLLRWRKEGYLESPFGAQSSAARARRKERSGATEHDHQKFGTADKNSQGDAEGAGASTTNEKIDDAKADSRKSETHSGADASDAMSVEHDDRERLVKLLGLLGSDQDGECVNAARKVEKLRKKLDKTWNDLIIPARTLYASAA